MSIKTTMKGLFFTVRSHGFNKIGYLLRSDEDSKLTPLIKSSETEYYLNVLFLCIHSEVLKSSFTLI